VGEDKEGMSYSMKDVLLFAGGVVLLNAAVVILMIALPRVLPSLGPSSLTDWLIVLLTFFYVVVTGSQLVLLRGQLSATQKAADAAKEGAAAATKSAEAAQKTLVDVQRAYMFVKSFHYDAVVESGKISKWRIVTQWENYGQTPALDVKLISLQERITTEQAQKEDFKFPTTADFSDYPSGAPIAPRSGVDSKPVFVTAAEAQELGKGSLTIVVGGRLQYKDIFTTVERHTEICTKVVIDPPMVGKDKPFRFAACSKYNSHSYFPV